MMSKMCLDSCTGYDSLLFWAHKSHDSVRVVNCYREWSKSTMCKEIDAGNENMLRVVTLTKTWCLCFDGNLWRLSSDHPEEF